MIEKREKTYTTFEIADICNVRPTTVIKWANQRRIKVYTTPGGHRRILESDLFHFLKQYNFPLPEGFDLGRKRVLIIEDETDVGLLLKKAFQRASKQIDVHWTDNGVEGLLAVGKTPPDLVVLDVVMPMVDGAHVLSTLRADPRTQQIKVIGMTGKRLLTDKLKFMQQHTDAFYFKPFKTGELVQKSLELIGIEMLTQTK
ncbi:MAG: response regulator [Elusimicrobia bacterium]|nr:response regulator [Elusimicrobiota bacterium]